MTPDAIYSSSISVVKQYQLNSLSLPEIITPKKRTNVNRCFIQLGWEKFAERKQYTDKCIRGWLSLSGLRCERHVCALELFTVLPGTSHIRVGVSQVDSMGRGALNAGIMLGKGETQLWAVNTYTAVHTTIRVRENIASDRKNEKKSISAWKTG